MLAYVHLQLYVCTVHVHVCMCVGIYACMRGACVQMSCMHVSVREYIVYVHLHMSAYACVYAYICVYIVCAHTFVCAQHQHTAPRVAREFFSGVGAVPGEVVAVPSGVSGPSPRRPSHEHSPVLGEAAFAVAGAGEDLWRGGLGPLAAAPG